MSEYALLLATWSRFEVREIARQVADVTGRTGLDAARQLHLGRGLLADRLPLVWAQQLGARLATDGLATFAVPDSELLAAVRPYRVTIGRPLDEGFEIEDQLQRKRVEPWGGLRVLAGAVLEVELAEAVQRERRQTLSGAWAPEAEAGAGWTRAQRDEQKEDHPIIDLAFGETAPRCYRIEAGHFNYQYLAADGRLTLRRDANFRLLLADLIARAPAACWATAATRAMAAGEIREEAVVSEVRLLDAELRWRCQRLRALGPPDGG